MLWRAGALLMTSTAMAGITLDYEAAAAAIAIASVARAAMEEP